MKGYPANQRQEASNAPLLGHGSAPLPDEPLGAFRHRDDGQLEREMTPLDDTLLEKVERLVDVSRQPLRWTSSTTVVIAQLVERIEALEAALREIADAVSGPGATAADYGATERRSSDRLSASISGSRRE